MKDSIINFRNRFTKELQRPQSKERLVIVGPRNLDDNLQAEACSQWLLIKSNLAGAQFDTVDSKKLPDKLKKLFKPNIPLKNLKIAMNLNISEEKMYVDGSYMTRVAFHGVVNCRILMMKLAERIPIVGDIGDPICCHYVNDLFSLGLVSSSNLESQTHRELASGVPFPVGFNSSTPEANFCESLLDHKIRKATDAMLASSDPHHFLSMTDLGNVAIASTIGNRDSFLVIPIQYNTVLLDCDFINGIIDKLLEGINYPKLMLDVGKVSAGNIKALLEILNNVLRSSISQYIIGFIIDSGDKYVPGNFMEDPPLIHNLKEDEGSANEDEIYSPISECLRLERVSVKNRLFTSMKSSYSKLVATFDSKSSNMEQYQSLLYADILINEIDKHIGVHQND